MSEHDEQVPTKVVGDDGIERLLVGAVAPLPTRTRAAVESVPDVADGQTFGPRPVTLPSRPAPGPGLPVSPRGPRPDWYPDTDTTPTDAASADGVTRLPRRVPVTRADVEALIATQPDPTPQVPATPEPVTPTPAEEGHWGGSDTPEMHDPDALRRVADPTEPVTPTPTMAVSETPSVEYPHPPVVEPSPSPASEEPVFALPEDDPADALPTAPVYVPVTSVEEVPEWASIRPSTDVDSLPSQTHTLPTAPPVVEHPHPDSDDSAEPRGEEEPFVEEHPGLPVTPDFTLPVAPPAPVTLPAATGPVALVPDLGEGDFTVDGDDETDPFDEAEESTDTAAAVTNGRSNKSVGLKLTDRDIDLLQFLTRYKYATYPQIAEYLGTSVNALRQRFPRMKKAGLITSDNGGPNSYLVWRPTDTGVKLSGYDMRTPSLSWGAVNHTLGLVDLGIRLEKAGEVVVTEREIRAADTRDRPSDRMAAALAHHDRTGDEPAPLYVVTLGAGQGQYSHIPDMVLVRAPDAHGTPMSVAIELELQRKPPTQWRKVLTAYKRSPNIGGVMYYTHRRDIARGITKIAAELGMADTVQVRPFTPSEGSKMPTPGVKV